MRTPPGAAAAEAWRGWQIEVVDDGGTPVLVLPFRSALLRADRPRTPSRQSACHAAPLSRDAGHSSEKPFARTKAPNSARCGSAYWRVLSSDQP